MGIQWLSELNHHGIKIITGTPYITILSWGMSFIAFQKGEGMFYEPGLIALSNQMWKTSSQSTCQQNNNWVY